MCGQRRRGPHRQAAAEAEADRADAVALDAGLRGAGSSAAPHMSCSAWSIDSAIIFCWASLGSVVVSPRYRSGASAKKPSAAKRSQIERMCSSRPHHSCRTIVAGPLLAGGHGEIAGRGAGAGRELDVGHVWLLGPLRVSAPRRATYCHGCAAMTAPQEGCSVSTCARAGSMRPSSRSR